MNAIADGVVRNAQQFVVGGSTVDKMVRDVAENLEIFISREQRDIVIGSLG